MSEVEQSLVEKLHSETALMHWKDLQRFFAQGRVFYVSPCLDLVKIASWLANDQSSELLEHIDAGAIVQPSNEQARTWYNGNAELWTVVVAPYVLIQEQAD